MSTTFSRSLLSVNDDIPRSKRLPSDGMMLSKATLLNWNVSPSSWPIARPRSTSMPWTVLLSEAKNSFGAYDASVATLTVPAFFSSEESLATAAALAPPVLTDWLPPEDEPPHPARTAASAAQAPRIAVRESGRVGTGTSSDHLGLDSSCQEPGKGPVQWLCQNSGAWLPSTTIPTALYSRCT